MDGLGLAQFDNLFNYINNLRKNWQSVVETWTVIDS